MHDRAPVKGASPYVYPGQGWGVGGVIRLGVERGGREAEATGEALCGGRRKRGAAAGFQLEGFRGEQREDGGHIDGIRQ